VTEPQTWSMFAHRYDDGKYYDLGEKWWVEIHHLSYPIVEVEVVEVAKDDPSATHWAWIAAGESEPLFSHPYKGGLTMCFPYGTEIEEKHGKGRVVRLAVSPVITDMGTE